MNPQFLGYEYTITYDDFERQMGTIQNINNIDAICLKLENRDSTYQIEYKEKYKFENKYLYSEIKYLTIENTNIPLKHRLVNSIYEKLQLIHEHENNISNDDIENCIEDFNRLMELNKDEIDLMVSQNAIPSNSESQDFK